MEIIEKTLPAYILAGSKLAKPAPRKNLSYDLNTGELCACPLGMAYLAWKPETQPEDIMDVKDFLPLFEYLGLDAQARVPYPYIYASVNADMGTTVLSGYEKLTLFTTIVMLFDDDEWTYGQIAAWIKTIPTEQIALTSPLDENKEN